MVRIVVTISLLLLLFFNSSNAINILVYSPSTGASHMNFMGHLADAVYNAGHNVTLFVPVFMDKLKTKTGVKTTKDVVVVEHDEIAKRKISAPGASLSGLWTSDLQPEDIDKMLAMFREIKVESCANLLRNVEVLEDMKSRNFDVLLIEPIAVCGFAFAHKLQIKKIILTSSFTHFDFVSQYIGEPEEYSYVPANFGHSSDKMDIFERYNNLKYNLYYRRSMEKMFDKEELVYKEMLGNDVPSWKELIASVSMYFTNSNPYIDFPRPTIQKTIPIGGITLDMDHIKSQKISEEWNKILNLREKTMLISFGSVVQSAQMPISWRDNILKVIESFPDVTFIWKYELEDTKWAEHVKNVHFSQWVPQTALLIDKRVTAFLTHGGLGSVNELAHCGKPALMIPIFGDQDRNANMLSRHGGAIVYKKKQLEDYDKLREAFKSILYNDEYRRNAERLAEILENQPVKPKDLVVKYTEFVAKFGPFPQMDPYVRHLNFIQRHSLDILTFFYFRYYIAGFSGLLVIVVFVSRMCKEKVKND